MQIPIIRMEVEGMKHAIMAAFMEHTAKLDEDMKAAVEQFCTPDNLKSIIYSQVKSVLDQIIRSEIDNFYQYGEGRKAIKEAVQKRLQDDKTELDC